MSDGPYCYVYDGNGLRVAKKSGANWDCTGGTVTKLNWRSITGDALAETDGSGNTTNVAYNEYVFFGRRRIASRNGSGAIFYYFVDQLGSTRTVTTGSGPGQIPGQLCYDADFTPYGQEISHTERLQTTACPPNYKFTGYERDPETAYGQTDTGLDYAFARYYSSRLGRFLSTDPLGGSIGNLQSLNRYAYVTNDPCDSVDPFGQSTCTINVSVNNQAGLSSGDLVAALIQVENIFQQGNDGQGNSVILNFSLNGSGGNYTLNFTNGGWHYPTNVVGHTNWCFPFLGCGTSSNVYVDHVNNYFSSPPGGRFLGTVGAHELATHAILGNVFDDCTDPNSITCSVNMNGQPPSATNNALSPDQIGAIFKICQKLQSLKLGGGSVSSGVGGGVVGLSFSTGQDPESGEPGIGGWLPIWHPSQPMLPL